jgi:hypothetical protein
MLGDDREALELARQSDVTASREDEHLQRDVPLEGARQHEVDQLARSVLVVRSPQDARELDLPEAAVGDDARRGRLRPRVPEDHLGRRARGVGDDDRARAVAAGGTREAHRVRLLPAVDDDHAARPELAPEHLPAVPEPCDRREHEREAGRRGGRVLDDELVPVARLREVGEGAGWLNAPLRVPAPVEVEAHLTVVDRRHAMLAVELERRIDGAELPRRVGLEDVARERALDEVVVDAEEDVAFGVACGQERPGDDLARVAALQDPEPEAALLLERPLHGGGDREGVVRDENHVLRRAASSAARKESGRPEGCEDEQRLATTCHLASPGRIARRTPRATSTRACGAAKAFETPRVDPGSMVSPRSG